MVTGNSMLKGGGALGQSAVPEVLPHFPASRSYNNE